MTSLYKITVADVSLLNKDEQEFEVRIRGREPETGKEALSAQLREILKEERLQGSPVAFQATNDPSEEISQLEDKLRAIGTLVSKFNAKPFGKRYRRLEARLNHCLNRAGLIPEEDSEVKLRKGSVTRRVCEILVELEHKARVSNQESSEEEKSEDENLRTVKRKPIAVPMANETPDVRPDGGSVLPVTDLPMDNHANVNNSRTHVSSRHTDSDVSRDSRHQSTRSSEVVRRRRRLPRRLYRSSSSETEDVRDRRSRFSSPRRRDPEIFKWRLCFTGDDDKQSLQAFLEQVEDRRVSRGVPRSALFAGASELLGGTALAWYRSHRKDLQSWEDLVVQLREAFQDEDYDHRLLEEIKARTQGPDEKVVPYISKIGGLFNRLSRPISEVEKVRIVERGVLPEYQKLLRLTHYANMRELETQLKNLEIGCTRSMGYRPPSARNQLEPDLAYARKTSTGFNRGHVSEIAPHFETQAPLNPRKNWGDKSNQRSSPGSNRVQYSTLRCWNCLEAGHRFRQCPVPWRRFCHVCGEPGAESRSGNKCRRISGNEAGRAYAEPVVASVRDTELRTNPPLQYNVHRVEGEIHPAPSHS
ncbi:hypothetical protein M8J77_004731 [Diaphorina citri]|nr:hypothetical protein M8J77_004731 [Diaphorina citri]